MVLVSNKNIDELNPAANFGKPNQKVNSAQNETANSQDSQTAFSISSDTPTGKYAGVVRRYAASSTDGMILGIVNSFLSMLLAFPMAAMGAIDDTGMAGGLFSLALWVVQMVISVVYYVYFIAAKGQTPGKKLFKIKVQKEETGANPNYVSAFLREIIGKIISGVVLGLGFIWIIFDKKKQGWHDKIAGTVAIEDGELSTTRKLFMYLLLILPILAIIGVITVIILVGVNPAAQLERARDEQMEFEEQQMEFEKIQQEIMEGSDES